MQHLTTNYYYDNANEHRQHVSAHSKTREGQQRMFSNHADRRYRTANAKGHGSIAQTATRFLEGFWFDFDSSSSLTVAARIVRKQHRADTASHRGLCVW